MQVNNVRVSFQRKKQPASYEEAAPAVEFAATLDDGENHVHVATALLRDAQEIVYAGLGYGLPEKVDKALTAVTSGKKPAKPAAEEPSEPQEPAQDAAETPEEAPQEPKKRGPGRPKGSKNTQPKKGSKAAKEQAAKGKAATAAAEKKAAEKADDDGLPPEDDEGAADRQISASPEDRKNPDDDLPPEDGEDLPEEAAATTGPADDYTAKDLHKDITNAYSAKKLSLANAKSILTHFRVARAQDLTPEQVVEGKAMLDKMLAASA